MQSGGWVKLHRKILEWEWYKSLPTRVLFLHLLLTANRETVEWHGITIHPGQKVTSLRSLAKETGLTFQQTRTAISNMLATHEITDKATNKYRLITIKKWNYYQEDNRQSTHNLTSNQHTNQHQYKKRRNKEIRNKEIEDKRERTSLRFVPPSLQEIENYCLERKNRISPQGFFDFYESKGWMIGKNRMKDWRAAIRTWERKEHGTQSEDVSASLRAIDISKAITTEL